MAAPKNKREFAEWCLRRLGAPVVEINISEDQVYDRIDEALNMYHQFHYNGTEKTYLKHVVTDLDKSNKFILVSPDVLFISAILPITNFNSASSLFNVEYQFALNDLWDLSSTNLSNYYINMQYLSTVNYFFESNSTIQFNYNTGKLFILDWSRIPVGQIVVASCYKKIDVDSNPLVWVEPWLQKYATELIKRQWASNSGKFDLTLPNGVKFNADKLMSEAQEAITKLEEELVETYSPIQPFFIG